MFPSPHDLEHLHTLADGRVRPSLRMTEDEFEKWADEDTRAEWVDGEVILMSPSNLLHSRLSIWFVRLLGEFLDRRPVGEILGPEFTIRLAAQRRRRVPDILFLASERADLLRPTYLEGAPDLAIEIVSPDSQSRDRREKYSEYEAAGVREYWIVDPLSRTVEAYVLGADRRFALIAQVEDKVASGVLPGFWLDPEWLWRSPLTPIASTLATMGV
jgi:Uma2 family endonuclease